MGKGGTEVAAVVGFEGSGQVQRSDKHHEQFALPLVDLGVDQNPQVEACGSSFEATPPAKAGKEYSRVNQSVEEESEDKSCVASMVEYVASSPPLRRIEAGLRRIPPQNASHPLTQDAYDLAMLLEQEMRRYANVQIQDEKVRWTPKEDQTLVIWKRIPQWDRQLTRRRMELATGLKPRFENEKSTVYVCVVDGEVEESERVLRLFEERIGCLRRITELRLAGQAFDLIKGAGKIRLPSVRLASFARTRGAAFKNTKAVLWWDDDPATCIKRLYQAAARDRRSPPSADQIIADAEGMNFDAMWDDLNWRGQAERLCRRMAATWDDKKVAKSPVFPGCFTTLLKIAIAPEELTEWSRQDLCWDEVEAVLNKITRNLLKHDRPNRIARNYWESAWESLGRRLKRKLNADKIGKITDLLARHGFITKRRGYKRPSLYGLGPKNPFARPHHILTAPTPSLNEVRP